MALTIDLESIGPGRGRLRVGGGWREPESVSLAIQRNDGRYLGLQQQWQVSVHWHPQFSAEPAPDGLRLEIGAELVDAIIAVGATPLRLVLRVDGHDIAGILRIRGALVGSDAAAPAAVSRDSSQGRPQIGLDDEPLTLDLDDVSDTVLMPKPAVTRRARWPWVVLALVLMLVLAGIGAWWFGLFERQFESVTEPETETTPVSEASPETLPTPESTDHSEPEPQVQVSGIAFAREFLSGGPSPEAIYARAETAEGQGDCPAAYALFSEAANGDASIAARLARRYDPLTHTPGPCISVPDIPYAIVYFTDAAESGDTEVQRRLGQLMIERESSGPTREAGIRWLRKAADAGDGEARGILDGLGAP